MLPPPPGNYFLHVARACGRCTEQGNTHKMLSLVYVWLNLPYKV